MNRLVSPLRPALSPGLLCLALVLFPLPWIDVQCSQALNSGGSRTVARQSGLQAAVGTYSEGPMVREMANAGPGRELRERVNQQEHSVSWSPWMCLYPVLLAAGIACGILLWRSPLRPAAAVACCAAVAAVLAIQMRLGFPIEHAVDRANPREFHPTRHHDQ